MRANQPRRCCYLDEGEVEQLLSASAELRTMHAGRLALGFHLRPVRRPRLCIGRPMVFRFRWRTAVDDGYLQEELQLALRLDVP